MQHRALIRLLLLLLGGLIAALVFGAASLSPRRLNDWDTANLATPIVILVLMVARLAASKTPFGAMVKPLAVWLALGLVLIVGYSYRDTLNGVLGHAVGSFVPSHGVEVAPGVMRFTADTGGQFFIDATVNGVRVHFLVDTGASGIALSRHDAERIGLDEEDLDFTDQFSTANGAVYAAPVVLNNIRIGGMSARSVRAWVDAGELDDSLLGMSFLSTLGRIEIKGDALTIER